jgi:tripartite ATP-independent transporter DctP family solute receptor
MNRPTFALLRVLPAFVPCVLAAMALLFAGCGGHHSVKVIKLAHGLDTSHPVHKAMAHMAKRLAERSGGAMRIDLYPSEQLGNERECVELVQLGGLGMTKVSGSVLEAFANEFKVFGLPYLWRDEAHKLAVWEGPVGRDILLSPEKKFIRGLCYYESGSRSFYTKDRPIRTPDDIVGLKIRVQESPMAFSLIRTFGGSATPISFGELYTALQQGVVDGAENNPPSFHLSRHYEVCKFYSLDEHTTIPDVLIVSTHLWESLTPEQQHWLQESADESAGVQRELWGEATATALTEVQKAGVEIIRPDKQLFIAKASKLHEDAQKDPLIGPLVRRILEVHP